MVVKVVNQSKHKLPRYETSASSGMDVRANLEFPVTLGPLERALIPTGLLLEIPEGFEAQIRPRSGLSLKKGLAVLNSPGTIDADYRGEIKIIMVNLSNKEVSIEDGERVCQMVFAAVSQTELSEVPVLSETARSDGGFGHTGI